MYQNRITVEDKLESSAYRAVRDSSDWVDFTDDFGEWNDVSTFVNIHANMEIIFICGSDVVLRPTLTGGHND